MHNACFFVSGETKKNPGILVYAGTLQVIHVPAKVGIFFQITP